MRQNIARTLADISWSIAVLIVAIACSRSPSAPWPVLRENARPTPTPTPTEIPPPAPTTYNLSGIVTADAGSPVANAQLALFYEGSFKTAQTSTDARGYYSIVFETNHTIYDGNTGVVGAIFYTGGGEYEDYFVQAVPSVLSGTADVVVNLRLRRTRTVNAGQSILISIDPDSSAAYDGEDWLRMDWVWETFHIRVADAGILTIDTGAGVGSAPTVAVFGLYRNVSPMPPPGKRSLIVQANSLLKVRLAIPNRMAPQRYEVTTFLQ